MSKDLLPMGMPSHSKSAHRMAGVEDIPQPGSWWRMVPYEAGADPEAEDDALKDASKSLFGNSWDEGQRLPDHGLILLLIDVRFVDGELHSLILAPHPGWRYGNNVALTADQFDMLARFEPDGEQLREAEKAATMSYTQQIHSRMGDKPDPEDFSRRLALKLEAQAKGANLKGPHPAALESVSPSNGEVFDAYARKVPAALLPTQDIVSAEAELRSRVASAEVMQEILEERFAQAGRAMKVVSRYQEEVVATALASISKQKKMADKMLTSVHTMKLWLGDGIALHEMTQGEGAAEGEKIHFMQSLLYLDEEIHCAEVLEDGFTADDLSSLSTFLSRQPGIVESLMPHQRCVAIARVRRTERAFHAPRSIMEMLSMARSIESDKTILIFVRDGERITVIEADGETSGAKRLFPSSSEINAIFTERTFSRDDPVRTIDVTDVRYADKRAQHDNVALFYKRFLLIIWGAHERAGIFGSFPKNLNWLTNDTHDRYFRFVHDEEFGLSDGVSQSIQSWLHDHVKGMRPGSRAVIRWGDHLSPETAPAAFNNPEHHQQEQIREPVEGRSIATITESEGSLYATCVCSKPYDWRHEGKTFNVQVRISGHAGQPHLRTERYQSGKTPGVFVLDHMSSREIERYLGSRKARQSYMNWMPEIQLALPEIRKRERYEEALFHRILADVPDLEEDIRAALPACVHEAVLAADWEIPARNLDPQILAQAARLARPADPMPEEALSEAIRLGGALVRNLPARPIFDGLIDEPFIRQQILQEKKGKLIVKSEKLLGEWMSARAGDVVIGRQEEDALRSASPIFRIPSLKDRSWIESVISADKEANDLLDGLLNPTSELAQAWVRELISFNMAASGNTVIRTAAHPVIGFAVLPPRQIGSEPTDRMHSLRAIRLSLDLIQHAFTAGFREEALQFGAIHKRPDDLARRLERNLNDPAIGIYLDAPRSGKTWRGLAGAPGVSFVTAGFRELQISSLMRDHPDHTITFAEPDLKAALSRITLHARAPEKARRNRGEFEDWVEAQRDIRVFLPDGIEEKLVKLIAIYEPLPQPEPREDLAP